MAYDERTYTEIGNAAENGSVEIVSEKLDTDFAKVYRVIPDEVDTTCVVANGAIKDSETKFTVPVGQTGENSVINIIPNWANDLYVENDTLQGNYIAKFKVENWDDRSIDYYIFSGGIPTTKGTAVVVDGVMTCEVEQTISKDYIVPNGKLYMQIKNAPAVTGSDMVVEFDGYYLDPLTESEESKVKSNVIYRAAKQILNELKSDEAKLIIDTLVPPSITEITAKRTGTAGVDADFVGLNAIGDALASITDATEQNTYKILVEGVFLFTDPSYFIYTDLQFDEGTIIVGKDWIDIEGQGKDLTVVAVELDSGASYPPGKDFTDYQPVMWNCNSKLSNMSIIAKNCRYNIHFEGGDLVDNKTLNIEHLYLENKGNAEVGGSDGTVFGTGMRDGQTWNVKNCSIKTKGIAFAMHTALNQCIRGGELNLINCDIYGTFSFQNCPIERIVNINLIDCRYNGNNSITYSYSYTNTSIMADYTDCMIKSNSKPLLYANSSPKGKGLRVASKSAGVASIVRFDETCTAFESIIGDSNRTVEETTLWQWKFQYGFYWKDGGDILKGFAVGGKDIDDGSSHVSLGKNLGDCSTVNKTLSLDIDSTTYDIVFDEDFTAQNNAYVIAKIDAVIGSVADVDEYSVGFEYYPQFGGMKVIENAEATAILEGMAIQFDGDKGMIKATSRMDGICLDDCANGQQGRVITSGRLFSMYSSAQRFKILDVSGAQVGKNIELGLSSSQAGYFDRTETVKVLRAYDTDNLKIIE